MSVKYKEVVFLVTFKDVAVDSQSDLHYFKRALEDGGNRIPEEFSCVDVDMLTMREG